MGIFSRKKPTPASVPAPKPAPSVKSSAVLIQSVVTEKATATGTYIFKVAPTASKTEVRKAFQAKYGKTPRKVNVLNVLGKVKMRGRVAGKRSNWKKAVIYLAKGETVDLFQ